MDNKRVLILREAGGLGDIIMGLPVARHYKSQGYQVEYLCLSGYAALVKLSGWVDRIYRINRPQRRGRDARVTMPYLRSVGFEGDARMVDFWCPAWRHEVASGGRPWHNRIETFWHAGHLPVIELPDDPMYGILPEPVEPLPEGLVPGKYIVVQAHTQDPARDVPPDMYWPEIAVALAQGWRVVSFGLREDKVKSIMATDYVTKQRLPLILTLIRYAAKLLCGDSAPLHIAAVYGTPAVAWFGPTNGRLICRHYPAVEVRQCNGCVRGGCYYQTCRGWDDCRQEPGYCKTLLPKED